MAEQTQSVPLPNVQQFVGALLGVVDVANEIPYDLYRAATEEELEYFHAGARVNLVRKAVKKYPGALYSFTDPRPEAEPHMGLNDQKEMIQKLRVHYHAFVFEALVPDEEAVKDTRTAFVQWAWKVLRSFRRKDPMEALADAWVMGFRPQEPAQKAGEAL